MKFVVAALLVGATQAAACPEISQQKYTAAGCAEEAKDGGAETYTPEEGCVSRSSSDANKGAKNLWLASGGAEDALPTHIKNDCTSTTHVVEFFNDEACATSVKKVE